MVKIVSTLLLLVVIVGSVPIMAFANHVLVEDIQVNCSKLPSCGHFKDLFWRVRGSYSSVEELRESFRTVISGQPVRSAAFSLVKKHNAGHLLVLDIDIEQTVRSIVFESNYQIDFTEVIPFLPYKQGEWFDPGSLFKAKDEIKRFLLKKGYGNIEIKLKKKGENELDLIFEVTVGKIVIVRGINYHYAKKWRNSRVQDRFNHMLNKPWEQLKFKVAQERLLTDIFNQGFFFGSIRLVNRPVSEYPGDVQVDIFIDRGVRHNFYFYFNHDRTVERGSILSRIKEKIKSGIISIDRVDFASEVKAIYQDKGLYNTKVNYYYRNSARSEEAPTRNHYFNIRVGNKVPLSEIDFRGNYQISDERLIEAYDSNATTLARRGYLDKKYLKKLRSIIKKKYVQSGYVFANVSSPKLIFADDHNSAKVLIDISEGKKTIIKQLNLPGVPHYYRQEMLKKIINRRGQSLDVTSLEADFAYALDYVKNKGHFYARIANIDSPDLLEYSRDYSTASINIDIVLGKKTIFNNLLITGNKKTKSIVIEREVDFSKGNIITPASIEKMRLKLIALSLFSKIEITPVVINRYSDDENHLVNLVVKVREKDYHSFELAPGYRTDIGFKLSSAWSYQNILGMNRSLTLKGQGNQRFDTNNFDARRREENKRMLEYRFEAEFSEPYLFPRLLGPGFDFRTSTVASRRRFYGFDGNIVQGSAQIAKRITDRITLSLKYQLETIDQYNATEDSDNGYFRIGSITPAIMYDQRDNAINPRSGAFLSLSSEFANDWFWSLNRDELEINYLKIISRNKYYFKINQAWGLATQISAGVQKNLATSMITDSTGTYRTRGHIPSIKVFRLDGIDVVRGFTPTEINLVASERLDISKIRVDNEAYFTNFKFEVRNYLDDSTVLAIFLDAGRVFVNTYRPLDLRSAVGVSFKYITPVGTMDFDYGFKTHRKTSSNGNREQIGRFHLSIGFF